MKFRTGFLVGAAVGAWAVRKAAELQNGQSGFSRPASPLGDEPAEKLKALSDIARERLSDLIEGPIGNLARDRIGELIGASLGSGRSGSRESVDVGGRWSDE